MRKRVEMTKSKRRQSPAALSSSISTKCGQDDKIPHHLDRLDETITIITIIEYITHLHIDIIDRIRTFKPQRLRHILIYTY